jgi:hypothetical protein
MKYEKELKELAHNLRMGVRYCELLPKVCIQDDLWRTVLCYGYGNNGGEFWFWNNYGSSAETATLKDLDWLLKTIFELTPAEFMNKYKAIKP